MSQYQVELISSPDNLPEGARATITDTFRKLFDEQPEAEQFALEALKEPPPAHTARVRDMRTGQVVWEYGVSEAEW